MSDYQRFISYIYEYKNQEKTQNCGFSKAEFKNGTGRLEIHIKPGSYPYNPEFQIYTFVPIDHKLQGIPLGTCKYQQGGVNGTFSLANLSIGTTTYSLHELGGIFIQADTGQIFASAWKDFEIKPSNFTLDEPIQDNTQNTMFSEKSHSDTSIESQINSTDTSISCEDDLTAEEITQNPWDELQESYPHIHPFFDDEIHNCIKISPDDVGKLSTLNLAVHNNPFFQHGCDNFHHFVIGFTQEGTPVLAVPGIYSELEHYLASAFGFPFFKPAQTDFHVPGQFVYWFKLL